MKRKLLLIFAVVLVMTALCSCRKNANNDSQNESTTPVEAIPENEENGFSGGLLEESDDVYADNQENTQPAEEPTQQTMPEQQGEATDTTSGTSGIPFVSGDSDLLEPPADSSAGVL